MWTMCSFFINLSTWHVKLTSGKGVILVLCFFFFLSLAFSQTMTQAVLKKCPLEKTPASQWGPVLSRRADTLSWTQIGCVLWSTPGAVSLRGAATQSRRRLRSLSQRIQPSSAEGLGWINNYSFFCLNVVLTSSNTSSTYCLFTFLLTQFRGTEASLNLNCVLAWKSTQKKKLGNPKWLIYGGASQSLSDRCQIYWQRMHGLVCHTWIIHPGTAKLS